jgi:hypothetical protein
MSEPVKPRSSTKFSWESQFLSWSLADQANALQTLQSLHSHAKRGAFGSAAAADQQVSQEAPKLELREVEK